jgi:hypothetical protein
MTSIGMRQDLAPQMALRAEHASVTRRVLLVSGILYPVLYVAADILGSVRWGRLQLYLSSHQ